MKKCVAFAVLALVLTASSAYAGVGWVLLLTVQGYTDVDVVVTTNYTDSTSCTAAGNWMKNKIQTLDNNLTVTFWCNNP